ncbi:MAG: adenylosuccinate synthetase [Proteobacteria bacterium]|nr:adenylosuccinate synthetase [Pseudomonadota bacterium]
MKPGFSDVLIGLQYGDEGKARIIDVIADEYDIIARFNGGSNAGHTIEAGDIRISLHQVPSGIFYKDKILYVGSGCVVNPVKLIAEIDEIHAAGVSLGGRFHISSLATLVQPHHILVDKLIGGDIGTTGQGIGPAYSDRALRMKDGRLLNIRTGDLLSDFDGTLRQIRVNLEATLVANNLEIDNRHISQTMEEFANAARIVVTYIQEDTLFLSKLVRQGKNVLFEGAQSFMLDVVKGSVPYVTSSSTQAAAAYSGGDLPPTFHRKTIGVAKAIMSRVGSGPFSSEFGGPRSEAYCKEKSSAKSFKEIERQQSAGDLLLSDDPFEVGVALRIIGNEYGATTGRPRRLGCLDLVQLAYAVKANGVDEIFLTKCDLLRDYSRTKNGTMPIVTGYLSNGKSIDYVPASVNSCRELETAVENLPCFTADISTAKSAADLPKELLTLLERINETSCQVRGAGVGPERDQFVLLES